MKISEQKLVELRLAVKIIRSSIIQLGCAMKPAAEKVVQATKEFEKVKKRIKN